MSASSDLEASHLFSVIFNEQHALPLSSRYYIEIIQEGPLMETLKVQVQVAWFRLIEYVTK